MFDQHNVPTSIRAETKTPSGEHPTGYNNPLCNEVGVLMPNENVYNRDVMLQYRDGGLQRISEMIKSS